MSEEALHQSFGARMKAARKARGMTQAELAGKVGCSRPNIVMIERGNHGPTLVLLYKIAAAVGASPVDLLPPTSVMQAETWAGSGI